MALEDLSKIFKLFEISVSSGNKTTASSQLKLANLERVLLSLGAIFIRRKKWIFYEHLTLNLSFQWKNQFFEILTSHLYKKYCKCIANLWQTRFKCIKTICQILPKYSRKMFKIYSICFINAFECDLLWPFFYLRAIYDISQTHTQERRLKWRVNKYW